MRRIIAGATGLIGTRLINHWLAQGHELVVIGRSVKKIREEFGARVQAISWDSLSADDLHQTEVVVNLAGANVAEKRWTPARKQEIIKSRVDTTHKLATLLATLGSSAPALFNASAIGVYGLQVQENVGLPARFDDISAIDKPADFLAKVGQAWEEAAKPAIDAGVRVVFLRFGIVLAQEGGALPKIRQPFDWYVGGTIGSGKQPVSWVALDDVIRAIDFLISQPEARGPFNIVAPHALTQKQFAQILAKYLNRPALVPMPAFVLKLMLGSEMATDLLLEGQHVYPKKLLDMNFQFNYGELETALNRILK